MGRLAKSLVVLTLAAGGCQFPRYVVRNLTFESCRITDEANQDHDIERMGSEAWMKISNSPSNKWTHSDDMHDGFMAGFTYLVKRGGDGEPPPVPPSCYWKESFRSPEGQARVQNWFSGYRLGTQVAREGHYRDLQVVTLSRPLYEDNRLSQQPQQQQQSGANLPYPRTLPEQGKPMPLPSETQNANPSGTR